MLVSKLTQCSVTKNTNGDCILKDRETRTKQVANDEATITESSFVIHKKKQSPIMIKNEGKNEIISHRQIVHQEFTPESYPENFFSTFQSKPLSGHWVVLHAPKLSLLTV